MCPQDSSSTVELLQRHRRGDSGALGELLVRHRDWLWSYVRRRMGAELRRYEASEDVVQDVLRKLIEQGPAFAPQDDDQFRRLVATIVLNRLRDRHDWVHAAKRARADARGLDPLEISRIGVAAASVDQPSRAAERAEEAGFVNLALQLIDPDEAHLIRLRDWEGLEFAQIGIQLDIEPDAARMRFQRAVRRLGGMIKRLQEGDLHELAPDLPPAG